MTSTMKSRAPDGLNVWCDNSIGLGHTLLRLSPAQEKERQPSTLDGQIWITADARIDGKRELIGKLRKKGRKLEDNAPDPELILHSYIAFGENFLQHLIGDFAFAIWDAHYQHLICATDQLGIRPFFYSYTTNGFYFASSITALRVAPDIGQTISRDAMADFLMIGSYLDPEATIYTDIFRLPAASLIKIQPRRVQPPRSYWSFPIRPNKPTSGNIQELTDEFKHLFTQSVADRTNISCVASDLSGGMDSTSITATASKLGSKVTAFTVTQPVIAADKEADLARQVATMLNIRHIEHSRCGFKPFQGLNNPELLPEEPTPNAYIAFVHQRKLDMLNSGNRVFLSGFMADSLFNTDLEYYRSIFSRAGLLPIVREFYRHWRLHGSLRGSGLKTLLHSFKTTTPPLPWPLHPWLNQEIVEEYGLEERWQHFWALYLGASPRQQLTRPWLSASYSAHELTNLPIRARFPFLDLRLIKFLSNCPPYIKNNKRILRLAMKGELPESILQRPKEGVAGNIFRSQLEKGESDLPLEASAVPLLVGEGYINFEAFQNLCNNFRRGLADESTFMDGFLLQPFAAEIWRNQTKL